MRRNTSIVILVSIFFLICGVANADPTILFSASSPQSQDGDIIISTDFTVDIAVENISDQDWIGGSFSLVFYSPNQSITDISHLDVDGWGSTNSIEYINNWFTYMNLGTILTEFSWDGLLPDSINLAALATNGIPPGDPKRDYIRFNIRIDQPGQFCIDSLDYPGDSDYDWVFLYPDIPSFNGPYCWTIGCVDDHDCDGILNSSDNCIDVYNPDQADYDNDDIGDVCDECTDTDNDGFGNPGFAANTCPDDNCPNDYNPGQEDSDSDGLGDACDICPSDPDNDIDNDGICGDVDNCPDDYNPGQGDSDNDGIGDACDECTDTDGDGYGNPGFAANTCPDDNCPDDYNPDQTDSDNDDAGDVCDNCLGIYNPDQADTDDDGIGDLCDECTDTDGDGFGNPGFVANTCPDDNCPDDYNPDQVDDDEDGLGELCDNCPNDFNPYQEDIDNDTVGDSCDNCIDTYNPDQADSDGNDIGDACDYICGDTNHDRDVNVLDIIFLIRYIYKDEEAPSPLISADVNCSHAINVLDIIYLINYLYQNGPEPICCEVW